jgi:cytochrome d ubiquinol oxidase subunit II
MLVGAAIMLPLILLYTAYVYSLFWGKVKPGDGYHA